MKETSSGVSMKMGAVFGGLTAITLFMSAIFAVMDTGFGIKTLFLNHGARIFAVASILVLATNALANRFMYQHDVAEMVRRKVEDIYDVVTAVVLATTGVIIIGQGDVTYTPARGLYEMLAIVLAGTGVYLMTIFVTLMVCRFRLMTTNQGV